MKNVIITGSTGMVGKGVLLECIKSNQIGKILLINRTSVGIKDEKVKEILIPNFEEIDSIKNDLAGYDACFYCMGVTSVGKDEKEYTKLTYTYANSLALLLFNTNKNLTFCYVSGEGTYSSEKGRLMWARVKGRTENMILNMGFKDAYMFRPGFIQPFDGIQSKTEWFNKVYKVTSFLYPVLNQIAPKFITNTSLVGKAMINALQFGYNKKHLQNKDINLLAS